MTGVNAAELAKALSVSPPRISQLVSEGKLDGCFHGIGRARRFDLVAVAGALGKRIDPGQRLGNGAATQRAAAAILTGEQRGAEEAQQPFPAIGAEATAPAPTPESRYEAARTAKVEEEARRARRNNLEDEGTFVLAEEVERQTRRQLAQEIAEMLSFLRDLARTVADEHQLDAKVVRALMLEEWRRHRGERADAAELVARDAVFSADESDADV